MSQIVATVCALPKLKQLEFGDGALRIRDSATSAIAPVVASAQSLTSLSIRDVEFLTADGGPPDFASLGQLHHLKQFVFMDNVYRDLGARCVDWQCFLTYLIVQVSSSPLLCWESPGVCGKVAWLASAHSATCQAVCSGYGESLLLLFARVTCIDVGRARGHHGIAGFDSCKHLQAHGRREEKEEEPVLRSESRRASQVAQSASSRFGGHSRHSADNGAAAWRFALVEGACCLALFGTRSTARFIHQQRAEPLQRAGGSVCQHRTSNEIYNR